MKPKSIIIAILYMIIVVSVSIAKDHEILFPAKKGGLWGYINTGGDWVIKAKYFQAQSFTEGLAAVKEYSKWGYIDKKGEWVILPAFDQAAPFEEGLATVVDNGLWGFINGQGDFIIPPSYEKASSFSEGLAVVANENHYRYINRLGDVVLDGAFLSASPFAEGLAKVSWEDRSGFINANGQLFVTHIYKGAGLFSEGLARVKIQSKWGYMDRSGNTSILAIYEKNGHFSEDLASVRDNGDWGFIDKTGNWVIKPEFESVGHFHLGYAVAKSSGKWGIIDPSGSWIVKPGFDGIGDAGKSSSLKEDLKDHIQAAYATWKTKREFETSAQYVTRLLENQQFIMDSIALRIIKDSGDKQLHSNKLSLGYYDADHEYFTIYMRGLQPASVAVPFEDARDFKKSWEQAKLSETEYSIVGEYFLLSYFTVEVNGNTYNGVNENTQDIISGLAWVDDISIPMVTWNNEDEPTRDLYARIAAKPGTSDVDFDIPETGIENKNTFALIIGNEDYKSYQNKFSNEVDAKYAATDARIFGKYVNKTLGVPKKNITLLVNATAGQIKQALTKMSKITKSFDGESEIIFYYSGHGLRDNISKKPYLLPVDVDGSDLSFAISLDEALRTLVENPHTRLSVFLDTDFTGGGRKENIAVTKGTGGVKIRPKSPFVKGNVVMFSAARDKQVSFSYDEKAHGMFTYFLLKKLKESRGNITYIELADYLNKQVTQNTIITLNREQTPDVAVSPSLEKVWERFTLVTPYQPRVFTLRKK